MEMMSCRWCCIIVVGSKIFEGWIHDNPSGNVSIVNGIRIVVVVVYLVFSFFVGDQLLNADVFVRVYSKSTYISQLKTRWAWSVLWKLGGLESEHVEGVLRMLFFIGYTQLLPKGTRAVKQIRCPRKVDIFKVFLNRWNCSSYSSTLRLFWDKSQWWLHFHLSLLLLILVLCDWTWGVITMFPHNGYLVVTCTSGHRHINTGLIDIFLLVISMVDKCPWRIES